MFFVNLPLRPFLMARFCLPFLIETLRQGAYLLAENEAAVFLRSRLDAGARRGSKAETALKFVQKLDGFCSILPLRLSSF